MPPPSTAGHAAGPWYVAPDGREANPPTGAAGPAEGEFTLVDSGLPALSSTPAAWGDYDNDGDLDILLEGYLNEPWSGGDKVRIYRNVGNGSFVDAYDLPDLYLNSSVAWGDYNNDGWLDILLTDGLLYVTTRPMPTRLRPRPLIWLRLW